MVYQTPKATWALVIGGAHNVFKDIAAATELLGHAPTVVAVKDIGIEYPRVDHWCTYHLDRMQREIPARAALGYPMPKMIWAHVGGRTPVPLPVPLKQLDINGGSSGLLGAVVGLLVAEKAVLCGIPMDFEMRHFNNRKFGKPWADGKNYWQHWEECYPVLQHRVRSMSGKTMERLGAPTKEWLNGTASEASS